MDQAKIGAFISELRHERGFTQEQLGEMLGVTNKTVSRWETGNYMPGIDTLLLLSRTFDVSINELLAGRRLEEQEFRSSAEDNVEELLRSSPFTRAECEAFWKKKWRREHIWSFLLCAAATVAAFLILPRLIRADAAATWCFFPVAAVAEYVVFYNSMMAYTEARVFDGCTVYSGDDKNPEKGDKKHRLFMACLSAAVAAVYGTLLVRSIRTGLSDILSGCIVCALWLTSTVIWLISWSKSQQKR